MVRAYSFSDLVQLPRLDSESAQVFGTEMIASAQGKRLPDSVTDALVELVSAHNALTDMVKRRVPPPPTSDPVRAKIADAVLDACWISLFEVLTGWSKFPGKTLARTASDLLAKLYPEGTKFVLLSYRLEWAESDTRLSMIGARDLQPALERLGAGPILERLRAAHAEYGTALGIRSSADGPVWSTVQRETRMAFNEALRRYMVCVSATVRKRNPETAELAHELLRPIERWESMCPNEETSLASGATDPAAEPL